MMAAIKAFAVTLGLTTFAAPAVFAYFHGWTIYSTAAPPAPEVKVIPAQGCAEMEDPRLCSAERANAKRFDPAAPLALRVGAILDRDQPRFTQAYGSAVEPPPEGEVYVMWDQHLVRIIEDTREITKVYFNAF